jgi:CRP-like cAMP-binding protein
VEATLPDIGQTCRCPSWSLILKKPTTTDSIDRAEGTRILSTRGWLSQMPPDFQQAVLSRCKWRSFEASSLVYHSGADDADLFGIVHGTVDFSTPFSAVDAPIVHVERAGFWFGAGPILSGLPRRMTASTRTSALLAQVTGQALEAMLATQPEWWRHLATLALDYGDRAANIAADLMIRDSDRRCVAVLLRVCGARFSDPPAGEPADVALTQEELAAMSNVSRNTLGELLRKLAEGGLIELGYRSIVLRQPASLRRIVNAA